MPGEGAPRHFEVFEVAGRGSPHDFKVFKVAGRGRAARL